MKLPTIISRCISNANMPTANPGTAMPFHEMMEVISRPAVVSEIDAREQCAECKQIYSPSLIESSVCIFCILKGVKAERDEAIESLDASRATKADLDQHLTEQLSLRTKERNEARAELDRIASLTESLLDSPKSLMFHMELWAKERRKT